MIKSERFKNIIEKWLSDNAVKTKNLYHWELETKAGKLLIRVDKPKPRAKVLSVFTRFDDHEKAFPLTYGESNPHSGKWNFHYTSKGFTADRLANCVINYLELVRNETVKR